MGVVDIFGNQVTGQGLATKPTYNFAEKMSAASNMTVLGSMFKGLKVTPEDERAARHFSGYGTSPEIDGDVRDYRWMQEKRQIISDFIPVMQEERKELRQQAITNESIAYLMEADTYQEFLNRRGVINANAKANAVFQEHPAAVFSSSIAMSLIEPWNLAGLPLALVKTGSKVASAVRMGAFGAAQASVEEGVLHYNDPNRTVGQSLISVGAAGTITGLFGAYLGRTKGSQIEALEEVTRRIKSIDDEGRVVIDLESDLIDPSLTTINLNLATEEEIFKSFKNLPGVGRAVAKKIIQLRNERVSESFESLGDLLDGSLDARTLAKINKIIDSGNYHANGVALSESGKIVGSYGVEKIAALSSPLMKLTQSPFPEVRRAAQELMQTNFRTTDNLKGGVNKISLEEIMDQNQQLGNKLIDDIEFSYYSYMNPGKEATDFVRGRGGRLFRQAGQLAQNLRQANVDQLSSRPFQRPGKLSFDEYKVAVFEHRTGSRVSTDPSIINASKHYDEFFDSRASEFKDLLRKLYNGEENHWINTVKYTHRIYNKGQIAESPEAFRDFLIDQALKKYGGREGAEAALGVPLPEMKRIFESSIRKLIASPEDRLILEEVFEPATRGASKDRLWTFIDDADLYRTNFAVKDIEAIANSYISGPLADIDFFRKYGTFDVDEIANKLRTAIDSRILKSGVDIDDLTSEALRKTDKDLELFKNMLRRVRGTYMDPNSPLPGSTQRVLMDNIKKFNNLRIGGGFAIKSLPDIGRSVMFLGLKRAYGPTIQGYVGRNAQLLEQLKASQRELSTIGVGNEINSSQIISQYTNTSMTNITGNAFTDLLGKANNSMFILNGLSVWNQHMKRVAGVGVVDKIIHSGAMRKAGKLSEKEMANIRRLGISDRDLDDIYSEYLKHGQSYKGVHLLNFQNWSKKARSSMDSSGLTLDRKMQLAVKREVDTIIVTPGKGDVPLIMENSYVSMIGQYRTFPIAAMMRQTVPLAQNMNKNAMAGLFISMGAGIIASQYSSFARGTQHNDDSWEDYLWESLEDTGNLSTIGEFGNFAQMIQKGNPALGGPTLTGAIDVGKTIAGMSNPEGMNEFEIRAAQRLVPMFGLYQMVKALPVGVATGFEKLVDEGL